MSKPKSARNENGFVPASTAQDILDHAPIGIFTSTPEGRFLSVNPAMARMYGYDSPQEMIESVTEIGRQIYADPSDREELMRVLSEKGEVFNYECRALRRDGSIIWTSRNTREVQDKNNRVVHYQGFVTEVTERKQTEQELAVASTELSVILETVPAMIWRKDKDCRYIHANKSFCDVVGIDMVNLKGRSDFDVHPKDIAQKYSDDDREVMASNRPMRNIAERHRKSSGEIGWSLTEKLPCYDQNGHISGTIGFALDITELMKTKEILLKSREEQGLLLDNIQTQVWHLADEHTYGAVNKAHADFLGFAPKEIAKRDMYEFLPREVVEGCKQGNREIFSKGRQVHTEEWIPNASGKQRLLSITKTPKVDNHGIIEYVVCSAEDITNQRLAEQELKEKTALLEAILDNTPDIMSVKRPDLSVVRYNKAGYAFLNKTQEQIEGAKCYELIGRNTPCSPCATQEAVKARQPVALEKYVPELDMHLNCRANPIFSDEGQVEYTVELIRDITARKKAEEEIRKFKTVSDQAVHGIAISDMQGNLLYINDYFAGIHGYEPDELIGRNLSVFHNEQQLEDIQRFNKALVTDGQYINQEVWHTHKNGNVFPMLMSGVVITDDQGIPKFLAATAIDITERKLAEEALREERLRLDSIIRGTNVGTWEWNVQTGETVFNERWAEIIGCTLDELTPVSIETWAKHTHPDDLKVSMDLLERHFSGDLDYYDCEARMKHKSGEWVWVLDRGKVFTWTEDGKPLWMYGTHLDITARKQAEQAIRESEARFRTLFNESPVSIIIHDKVTGEILDGNAVSYRTYGLDSLEELQANEFWTDPPYSAHDALQWIHKAAAEGVQQFEWKNITINGDVFWEHVTLQPVVIDGDERILSVAVDTTKRKRADEKIRTINEQLQKANAEKDMLFTIIAHDLKSPMSGLLTSTELLAHQPDSCSEKDLRLLSTALHKSARNTYELLEDLLQWARLSQGGIDFAPTPCSLNELVNMGLSTAQDLAKSKEISISSDIHQGLTVLIDQPMIKTVIRNILFNAIKFTPRQGEIVITARQEEQKVTVAVQDNGVGMNEQVLSSVFTLEKEKRQLGTEGEKGTGLGLMLCKQFIEQHGGHIWAESEPGKGTTVFFTLPTQETRTP